MSDCIYKKWDQQGIKNINDLIHENGKFHSQDEFKHTYDIKTIFVQILGLKQAVMAYARTYNIISFSKKCIHHCCLQVYTF